MTSTKQTKKQNPLLTSRAALTTPPGTDSIPRCLIRLYGTTTGQPAPGESDLGKGGSI